ncbi:M23 family metallopeptidase [Modestobacter sp. SYSU DS0290]
MSVARLLVLLVLVSGTLLGPAAGPATPAPAPPSSPGPAGVWGWPLPGPPEVSRAFDPPPTPYAAGHRGVDLLAGIGAPVVSAGDGVVAFAGMVAGRPVVSVEHPGGLRTTYEPVQPAVAAGQVVARGSPLGTLVAGHTGCPVEACLHWGLRHGEVYLDPLSLLQPPRISLLPWP